MAVKGGERIPNANPKVDLFAWGANSYGQLADGTMEDSLIPKLVERAEKLLRSCTMLTGGGGHTLGVRESGGIISCGWNNRGQLGLHDQQGERSEVPELHEVLALGQLKVTQVAAGWDSSFALTETGQLWSWGSNAFGQLGRQEVKPCTSVPGQVTIPEKIIRVEAGLRHTLALTDSGQLYSWGSGKKGQLGWLQSGKCPTKADLPTTVTQSSFSSKVVEIAAGAYHSLALSDDGAVYVWGNNKHGQTTLDPALFPDVHVPHKVAAGTFHGLKVVSIYTGWTHNLALTETGQLYSWGRNNYGQLGRSSEVATHDQHPGVISEIHQPSQVVCGSEHNLVLFNDGRVCSWGWNEHGICGTGDETNVCQPHHVTMLNTHLIVLIGCGNGHSFAIGYQR